MKLRIATPNDAAAVLSIYSQYIHTPVTFEYELPPQEEFARRIGDTLKRYPYLVCADSGRLCGYAYAHRFGERAAYQWSAELSIYLDAGATARGIGRTLYSALIELLRRQGIRTVCGCVTTPNPRSEKLHAKLGFRKVGTFRRSGYKNGGWHDVTWFEREIISGEAPPREITPFPQLDPQTVAGILDAARFSGTPGAVAP
ncbi:MAG: N-acetyltransferase [Lentisphaeria bacterium]|uniref:GNAT family N-acetyltransferase n=1 Tax=uncultured Victivallis sp. TaxID=354118 RepID=UPI001DB4F59F|nr:GNAT family N-acetyltransferase [uncultured Victivallis sp.]MBS1455113.1 N-acetyltransferase [Lentisphaeria bacterium]